jgi:hypothetical protein
VLFILRQCAELCKSIPKPIPTLLPKVVGGTAALPGGETACIYSPLQSSNQPDPYFVIPGTCSEKVRFKTLANTGSGDLSIPWHAHLPCVHPGLDLEATGAISEIPNQITDQETGGTRTRGRVSHSHPSSSAERLLSMTISALII